MPLSVALLVIFLLWLIDKHDQWRRAAKITLVLLGLCVLAIGGMYAWDAYQKQQEEKKQAAVKVQEEAAEQACMKRFKGVNFFDAADTCSRNPAAEPPPPQPPLAIIRSVPSESLRPVRLKRVKNKSGFDIEMKTTEYGSLNCGVVKPDEVATLLSDGGFTLKVRTRDGKVGWVLADYFAVVE